MATKKGLLLQRITNKSPRSCVVPAAMMTTDVEGYTTLTTTTTPFVNITATGNTVLGDAASDTLTVTATVAADMLFGTTKAAQFRTSAISISSANAGYMDIAANTGVRVTSPLLSVTGKVSLGLNGGAVSASGLLLGVGTTASPATTAVADAMFAEFRTQSTATTGTSRGIYRRHELAGAGADGEALRAFTKLSAATTTARGAQISLDVNTTGSLTGLGAAVDAQILVPNQALGTGTYGVVNSEIYSAGSSSSVAASNISFFRAVASGDAAGIATVDTAGNLFNIQGVTVGSGKLFQVNTAVAASHALRILINNVPYYIMLTNAGA